MGLEKTYHANELGELFLYALYNAKAVWNVTKVDAKAVRKLRNDINEDFSGYALRLHSDYMIHFLNSHFYEKRPDHRSITFADIEKIGEIVNGYKTVEFGNRPDTLKFRKYRVDGIFELVVKIDRKGKAFTGLSFRIMRC